MNEKNNCEVFEKAKAEKLTLEDEALKGVSGGEGDGICFNVVCEGHVCTNDECYVDGGCSNDGSFSPCENDNACKGDWNPVL